jgi:hypothetical protein
MPKKILLLKIVCALLLILLPVHQEKGAYLYYGLVQIFNLVFGLTQFTIYPGVFAGLFLILGCGLIFCKNKTLVFAGIFLNFANIAVFLIMGGWDKITNTRSLLFLSLFFICNISLLYILYRDKLNGDKALKA